MAFAGFNYFESDVSTQGELWLLFAPFNHRQMISFIRVILNF